MAKPHHIIPILTAEEIDRFWSHVDKNGPIPAHRPELGPCWIFGGLTSRKRYRHIQIRGKKMLAHRVAFFLEHGTLPPFDQFVCHRCDNPACVRIPINGESAESSHLFAADQLGNMADAVAKGRMPTGDRHFTRRIPGSAASGEQHWTAQHPDWIPRGDNHYLRLHPEKTERLKGEGNPQAKLTTENVLRIRALHAEGKLSGRRIAKLFDISEAVIYGIIRRKIWRHIP